MLEPIRVKSTVGIIHLNLCLGILGYFPILFEFFTFHPPKNHIYQ
jgi:hypothetical protein